MKPRICLILSLALNLLLAGVVLMARAGRGSDRSLIPPPTTTNRDPAMVKVVESEPEIVEVTAGFHWSQVESDDYRVYLENLRAVNCPEQRIRDIIVADVNQLFAGRVQELVRPYQGQFWELMADPKRLEKLVESKRGELRDLERERDGIFQDLFGESDPQSRWQTALNQTRQQNEQKQLLDFLGEEKRAEVVLLLEEQKTAVQEIQSARLDGARDEQRAARREAQNKIRTDTDRKLQELLTADEFAEYKLRSSNGAGVRYGLARMDVSEDEIRAVAQIMSERQDAEQQLDRKDESSKELRQQLQQQADEELRQYFGDARYQEYQRATDHRFNQIAAVAERLNLPEAAAIEVYQMQLESEKQAAKLRQDSSLTDEHRAAALAAVQDETLRSIRLAFGDKGASVLQKNAGDWISKLAR